MHLLVDSDSLCYQAGFAVNGEGQEALACWQVEQVVDTIVKDTGCDSFELFLSGSDNFRYAIHPEYKGNRKNMVRPIHLQAMRERLVTKYGAHVSSGNEADDAIGIAVYARPDAAIAHIDKDLDMLEGRHYNYNKKIWYDVDGYQAMRHFFYQLIMGDRADNIPSFDGVMRITVPKKLQWAIDELDECETYGDMLLHVADMYGDWNKFKLSADCLWLQRKENDKWENWMDEQALTEVSGLRADLIHSSPPFSEVEVGDGAQSIDV